MREVRSPRRILLAVVVSVAVLASGCTIGQTRFALGVTLAADATTTVSAMRSDGAQEKNPVLQNAPVPIMLVLSGVVALVAEKHVRNGEIGKAKALYRIASIVHGLAATWNGFQMGKGSGSTSAAARPTARAKT